MRQAGGIPRHRQQWQNTLDTYVMPHMGEIAVGTVDSGAVMRVLEPIWHSKPETASRVRGRIESVLGLLRRRAHGDREITRRVASGPSEQLVARARKVGAGGTSRLAAMERYRRLHGYVAGGPKHRGQGAFCRPYGC